MADNDLKSLLTSYFNRGFTYEEIRRFLDKNHDRCLSIATLKRRMKDFGLKRRDADYDEMEVREHIRKQLDGSSTCAKTVTLPLAHMKTLEDFKQLFITAFCKGQSFARP